MKLAGMPKGSPSTLPLQRKRLRPGDDAGAPAQGETLPRSRPHTRGGRMAGSHSLKMRRLRPNTSWNTRQQTFLQENISIHNGWRRTEEFSEGSLIDYTGGCGGSSRLHLCALPHSVEGITIAAYTMRHAHYGICNNAAKGEFFERYFCILMSYFYRYQYVRNWSGLSGGTSRIIRACSSRDTMAKPASQNSVFCLDEIVRPTSALHPPANQGWRGIETMPVSHMTIMPHTATIDAAVDALWQQG